jgi:hypothetical protein
MQVPANAVFPLNNAMVPNWPVEPMRAAGTARSGLIRFHSAPCGDLLNLAYSSYQVAQSGAILLARLA